MKTVKTAEVMMLLLYMTVMVLMITAMIVVIIHVINLPDESWMVTSRNPVTGRDEAPLGHWIVGSHDTNAGLR